MEDARKRAYRLILSAGMLHLKWDLACWYTCPSRPTSVQTRSAQQAAFRSAAFHNLVTFEVADYAGFSEEQFWQGIIQFQAMFPDALCPYREMFDRCLRGELVRI